MSSVTGSPKVNPSYKVFGSSPQPNQISNTPVLLNSERSNLYSFYCYNPTGGQIFVNFYDQDASPVVGTDVPKDVFPVRSVEFLGLSIGDGPMDYYSKSIWVSISTNIDGTGSPAAGVFLKVGYQQG